MRGQEFGSWGAVTLRKKFKMTKKNGTESK